MTAAGGDTTSSPRPGTCSRRAPSSLGNLAQLFCEATPPGAPGASSVERADRCPVVQKVTGRTAFRAHRGRPALSAVFTEAMAESAGQLAPAIVAACDLDSAGIRGRGGGNGTLLAAFLARRPRLRGVLFDTAGRPPGRHPPSPPASR
ncbi:hypothetical protein HBB16_02385 [Pseudonocardia sp. MCCB 268]|nr:hypothetical protein [Pseudonocardia cytotoxica]